MTQPSTQEFKYSNFVGLDKIGVGIAIYAYAVLLGACYLIAFWRPFGFNIFPFLSLHDYVSAPLNRLSVLIALPMTSLLLFSDIHRNNLKQRHLIASALALLYVITLATGIYEAVWLITTKPFSYRNEASIMIIAGMLSLTGIILALKNISTPQPFTLQIAFLITTQCGVSMFTGYRDGKVIYNNTADSHYLLNTEICSPNKQASWTHIGTFDRQTIFMETRHKRLCFTETKDYRLISYQQLELLINSSTDKP